MYPVFAVIIAVSLSTKSKKINGLILIGAIIIQIANLLIYRNEYIVPDVALAEAQIAREAANHTDKNEQIFLTNYYVPTTVFYSNRQIYAVFSEFEDNSSWWVRPKSDWKRLLKREGITIISTKSEIKEMKQAYPDVEYETLYEYNDKLLLRVK